VQVWEKKGRIYSETRAQTPIIFKKSEDIWRIYYSDRDKDGKSYTKYLDVEAGNPSKIIKKHDKPLLTKGGLGMFDVSGNMPSSIVRVGSMVWLYYIGWVERKDVPYRNSIGLAISEDGGDSFYKYSEGPVFGPTTKEPGFTGTSHVIRQATNLWVNYYLYCTGWIKDGDKLEPRYRINYATSTNGINWRRDNLQAIGYTCSDEGGIVSASVIASEETWPDRVGPKKANGECRSISNSVLKMWYSYRATTDYRNNPDRSYRIGYAKSLGGASITGTEQWLRYDDEVELVGDSDGWDSEMQCYPQVIEHEGELFMFYNGNGFGETGFGYAKLIP
jgi:hypothetical protein